MLTMNKFSHQNKWNTGTLQLHVETPPIPLIKSKNDGKLDKYSGKVKLRRDPTPEKSDLYEFKMALFDNGKPEKLLLCIRNFNMTLETSGTLKYCMKI